MAGVTKASRDDILAAGQRLQGRGKAVNGTNLRLELGRGRPDRMFAIWEEATKPDLEQPPEALPEVLIDSRNEAVSRLTSLIREQVLLTAAAAWRGAERVSTDRAQADIEAARAEEAGLTADFAITEEELARAEAMLAEKQDDLAQAKRQLNAARRRASIANTARTAAEAKLADRDAKILQCRRDYDDKLAKLNRLGAASQGSRRKHSA